eukprot:TRINITY_DN2166_c0_g1_i2.p1 TRINITY_DN2166_c0_g1~~TRINITY_DN2166_c0_g1_i2.p1  ORF type:complete len:972 (+),score=355.90 TRINITY_DN2166_c0_g1_i2:97-3012(+)
MNRQLNVQRLLMTDEAILGLIYDFLDSRNLKQTSKTLERECKESNEREENEGREDSERPKLKPQMTELEELLLQAKVSSPSIRKTKVVIVPEGINGDSTYSSLRASPQEMDQLNYSSSSSFSTPLSTKGNWSPVELSNPEDEEKERGSRDSSFTLRMRSNSNEKSVNSEEDTSLVSFLDSSVIQDQNEDQNFELLKSISFEDQEGEQSHHSHSSHSQERSKREHISFDEPQSDEEIFESVSFNQKKLRGSRSMTNLSEGRIIRSPPPNRNTNKSLLSPVIAKRHIRSKSESFAHSPKIDFYSLPEVNEKNLSNRNHFVRNYSPPPVTFHLASSQETEEEEEEEPKLKPSVFVQKVPSFIIEGEVEDDNQEESFSHRSSGLSANRSRPMSRSGSVSSILRMRSSSVGSVRSSKSVSFRGESDGEEENYEEGEEEEGEWDEDELGYTKVHMDDFEIEQLLRYHQQEIEDSIFGEEDAEESIMEEDNKQTKDDEELDEISDSSQEDRNQGKEKGKEEDLEGEVEVDDNLEEAKEDDDEEEMQVSSVSEENSDSEEEEDDDEEDEDEAEEVEDAEKLVTVKGSPMKHENVGPLSQFFRFLSGFGGTTSDAASVQSEATQDDDHYEYSHDGIEYETFGLPIVRIKRTTGLEESKDYKIVPGNVIAGRYQIVKILGSAAFSTAVECVDCITEQRNCVKIIKNNKEFFDQSLDEIKLLQYLNSHGNADQNHVLQIYDYFYHKEHLFVVTELLQQNLYEITKNPPILQDQMSDSPTSYFTLERIKSISKQLLSSLDFVHSLGIIHCDLKPENILVKDIERCQVKIIDFGSSCFVTDHLSSYVQSRSYRAPEVILGLPYGTKIDVWSLGCVLAELWTGTVLFQNESVVTLLAKIAGALGNFEDSLLKKAKYRSKFFTENGQLYEETKTTYFAIKPKKTSLSARLKCEDPGFVDFLSKLLIVNPDKRLSARDALNHEWLNS